MFSLPFLILEIVGDKNATGEGIELIFEHLRSFVKVLEVHEKSDLVPAPVHEEKNDCVPQSDHEIWQKSDLSSRSRSRSWHIIICFKSRVEVTNFDISQNISGMLNTFGCSKLFY